MNAPSESQQDPKVELVAAMPDRPDPDDLHMRIIRSAKNMKQLVEAYKMVRTHVLDMTEPDDWMIHGQDGDPDPRVYLCADGAIRIGLGLGVQWGGFKQERIEHQDSNGAFYEIVTTAHFMYCGRYIEATGSADTRDSFFSHQGQLDSDDVDIQNIRYKSETACVRRGISAVLALRGLRVSHLPDSMKSRVLGNTVGYVKGNKGGSIQEKGERELAVKCWNACITMCGGDVDVATKLLETVTKFKGDDGDVWVKGPEHLKKIKSGWLQRVKNDLEKEWRMWNEKGAIPYVMADFEAPPEEGQGDGGADGEPSSEEPPVQNPLG